MYTASEVYGKDPEMRHNSQTTKSLTNNNNNSNSHNDQHIPFCNVDNALNYYKKNVNLIGATWKLKSPSRSSNPSPSKNNVTARQICRSNYTVPTSESLHYSDAYVKSYAPRKVSGATSGGNNNHHVYQQLRQQQHQSEYYNAPHHKVRQYAHSNSAPATQEMSKYSPASLEKDQLKRQIRAQSTSEYLDGGSMYSHNRRPLAVETSWSSVM